MLGARRKEKQALRYNSAGSRVKSSLAWPTPRRAKRPTETSFCRSGVGRASANDDEIKSGRSTERHIEAMRLVSFTAGPTT